MSLVENQETYTGVDFEEIDSTLESGYRALRERIADLDAKIERVRGQRDALRLQLGRLALGLGERDDLVWAHLNGDEIRVNGRRRWGEERRTLALDTLSPREREVFDVLGRGASTREVSDVMGVVHTTVETYVRRIREKLDIESFSDLRYEAIVFALDRQPPSRR